MPDSPMGLSVACAANTCRREAVVKLRRGNVTLTLCERHARTYRSLGYEPIGADEQHTLRGRSET